MVSSHSIRIGPTVIDAFLLKFADISGVVIIKHTDTKKEHCHVYFRHRTITGSDRALDKLKKELKEQLKLEDVIKTNRDWAWTNPDTTLEAFWNYAMYEKGTSQVYKRPGASVLLWNVPELQPEMPPDKPISITVKNPTVKVNTYVKRQRFYQYCREYYDENPEKEISSKKIAKLLFHYWKAGGEEGAERLLVAKEYINSCLYKLLKDSGDSVAMKVFETEWISRALK